MDSKRLLPNASDDGSGIRPSPRTMPKAVQDYVRHMPPIGGVCDSRVSLSASYLTRALLRETLPRGNHLLGLLADTLEASGMPSSFKLPKIDLPPLTR